MNEIDQLKNDVEELKRFKASLESSYSIPLAIDQSFRKRFSTPIIVKRTVDVGNTLAQSSTAVSFDIPEAAFGDLVVVTPPSAAIVGNLGGIFTAYVASTGIVTIKFFNPDASSALNPGSGEYTVAIFKPAQ